MAELKTGEIGKTIIISTQNPDTGAEFDMSANTDLQIVFIAPDSTTFTRTSIDGVTAPAVPFVSTEFGTFAASTYFSYDTQAGDIFRSGDWIWYGVYIDGTPKDFKGDSVCTTVIEPGVCE